MSDISYGRFAPGAQKCKKSHNCEPHFFVWPIYSPLIKTVLLPGLGCVALTRNPFISAAITEKLLSA